MELESQVTSLEISQKLKMLGVKQESYFVWLCNRPQRRNEEKWEIKKTEDWKLENVFDWYPAFSCSELGEMLPKGLVGRNGYPGTALHIGRKYPDDWFCGYSFVCDYDNKPSYFHWDCCEEADTLADAMGKMLCYLYENGLIK